MACSSFDYKTSPYKVVASRWNSSYSFQFLLLVENHLLASGLRHIRPLTMSRDFLQRNFDARSMIEMGCQWGLVQWKCRCQNRFRCWLWRIWEKPHDLIGFVFRHRLHSLMNYARSMASASELDWRQQMSECIHHHLEFQILIAHSHNIGLKLISKNSPKSVQKCD